MNYLAFLSYSRADDRWFVDVAPCVQRTLFWLAEGAHGRRGLPCTRIFRDEDDLPPVGPLPEHIRDALHDSHFIIALVGVGYIASDWCRFELEEFSSRFPNREERLNRTIALVLEREALEDPNLPDALDGDGRYVPFYDDRSGLAREHFAVDVNGTRFPHPLLVLTLRPVVSQMVEYLHAR